MTAGFPAATAPVAVQGRAEEIANELKKFGLFQRLQYAFICLAVMVVSMMNVNFIFIAEETSHRCRVVECESANASVTVPTWWPQDSEDPRCYSPAFDPLLAPPGSVDGCNASMFSGKYRLCDQWVYEHQNSIVSKLGVGCASWKVTLVGSVHSAGMFLSMFFMGWLADRFGRKRTLIFCAVGGGVGLAKAFVSSYEAYLAIEFLESVLSSGLYTVGIVLLLECGGRSTAVQVAAGVVLSYAHYCGELLFALLAMYLRHWSLLIYAVYGPALLFLLYELLLKESAVWQLLRGDSKGARSTFKLQARLNRLPVTSEEIDALDGETLRALFEVQEKREREKAGDVIASSEIMIRLAVSSVAFFSASFIYYGLAINSVLLPGDKYTNFILTSLTSFPGDLVALLAFRKYGTKRPLQAGYLCCAVFLLAQAFVQHPQWVKLGLFLLGRVGAALCFTGMFTYSLGLFPTSVRGALVGLGNAAARLGSMLAPLTPLLVSSLSSLPAILFATTALTAAILLERTPDTTKLPLHHTVAQLEAHQREKIKEMKEKHDHSTRL